MLRIVERLYAKRISSKGLGIFRILFSLNLLLEVFRIYRYQELYFDPIPFIKIASTNYSLLLILWMIVLFLQTIGAFTRVVTIISYAFTVYFMGSMGAFEYHMDHIYVGVGFLMMLAPISRSFSMDRYFLNKLLFNNKVGYGRDEKVPAIYYNLFVIVGIGFMYFGSIFFKFKSEVWMNGLGLWLPASLPQVSILADQWLLNQEFLIKFIGYFTIIFEVLFPFIFFIKKLRVWLFAIGLVLHIGILLEFPIPYFGLGMSALYVLVLPVSFWERVICWWKSKFSGMVEIEVHERSDTNLSHDIRNNKNPRMIINGLNILVTLLFLFQFNATFNFPLSEGIENRISERTPTLVPVMKRIKEGKKQLRYYTKRYLGITQHGLFIDGHFKGFDQIYTLKNGREFLPMFNMDGMPQEYLCGGSWANYNFRVNGPYVTHNSESLREGFIRYSAFWAYKNDLDLDDLEFIIVTKEIEGPFKWEKDMLRRNREATWDEIGTLMWRNNRAHIHYKE